MKISIEEHISETHTVYLLLFFRWDCQWSKVRPRQYISNIGNQNSLSPQVIQLRLLFFNWSPKSEQKNGHLSI